MVAWTSPRTWVSGAIVTAAQLNTHLRDNLLNLFDGVDGTITSASSPWALGSTYTLVKKGRTVILNCETARSTGSSTSFTTFATIPAAYRPAADTQLASSCPSVSSGVITKAQVTSTGNLQIAMSGANTSAMHVVGVWQAAS